MTSAIPKSLLDLLVHQWRREKAYSAFASNYEGDRMAAPSFYIHSKDGTETGVSPLKFGEVSALIEAGVLDGLAKDNPNSIAVVEHAEHAITDFASDVYRAWDKLSQRLEAVRLGQPMAGKDTIE